MATATQGSNGNGGTALAAPNEREMSYVPFASKDAIKLTVSIVKNLVSAKTKSGATASDADAMKFMMLCKARGLNPFEGDAYLIGYDTKDGPAFSLITSHQAFLKRAEVNNEYDGMSSGVIVRDAAGAMVDREGDFIFDDDTILGGWATVYFKNRTHPMRKRLKLATFHKGFGLWQSNPAGMIVKCAEADALRSSFPTMLGGMYAQEEMPAPEIVDVKPVAPPVGRSRISPAKPQPQRPVEPPPPVQEPTEEFPPAEVNEDADTPPDEDAERHLDDLAETFLVEIAEASSALGTKRIGEKLKEREAALGVARYGVLVGKLQEKNRELAAAKK